MNKKLVMLSLAATLAMGSTSVMAEELVIMPINAPVEAEEEMMGSIHQISYSLPLPLAELMYLIVSTVEANIPEIMDTHYAMPAMQKAEELGIINLDEHPMETWLEPVTEIEFNTYLTKAMQSEKIDIGAVYTVLNGALCNKVSINGELLDLGELQIKHYKGNVMLPLRPVAEALGFTVEWEPEGYRAIVNTGQVQSPVEIGFDHYYYTSVEAIGMSQPTGFGAPPQLIDGATYVPINFFGMFVDMGFMDRTIQIGNDF